MSRRVLVRMIVFLIFSFILLIAMTVQNIERAARYEQIIFDSYYRSFFELLSKTEEIDSAFELCLDSENDLEFTLLCVDILRDFEASLYVASMLPLHEASYKNLDNYISRIGKNTYIILDKILHGQKITENERMEIEKLSAYSKKLLLELNDISSQITKDQSFKDIGDFEINLNKYILLA